jgi:lysozyme
MLLGIDVSDFQGRIDWQAVAKSGVSFAVAKASEGQTLVSETFATNWAGMKAAGLVRGAYHFFRPTTDPVAQANTFLRTAKTALGDLPPVLDVEVSDGVGARELNDRVAQWLRVVETATKRQAIIYTSLNFWRDALNNSDAFRGHPLWIAQYDVSAPLLPGNWSQWMIWQYSDSGRIAGVQGNVDVNRFNGPIASLRDFTQGYIWLAQGNRGPLVTVLQQKLQRKGFNPGAIDGVFGAATRSALIAFQRSKKLSLTGVSDAPTQRALDA